jgi:hypothetical protein
MVCWVISAWGSDGVHRRRTLAVPLKVAAWCNGALIRFRNNSRFDAVTVAIDPSIDLKVGSDVNGAELGGVT